jgi:cell division protein FtsL
VATHPRLTGRIRFIVGGGRAVSAARVERRRRIFPRLGTGQAIALAALLLCLGLAHVWVQLQITEFGYELSTARDIVERLEQEQQELESELAMLTSPQRLADEAGRRLEPRLREPEPGQVVVLR